MKKNNQTRELVYAAMLAAVISVMSQISLPLPSGVPVTLQTMGVAMAGYILGKKWGTVSVGVYILLGAAGMPVFSGFKSGISSIVGVTGGFIWGFLPMAFLCGTGGSLKGKNGFAAVLTGLIGLAVCHLCGVLQWMAIKGGGLLSGFLTVSAPYLVKDVLSVAAACFAAELIVKRMRTDKT